MKRKIFEFVRVIGYSLLTSLIGLGIPMISSLLLFGRDGLNDTMVIANNIIMGVIGAPVIFLLVKRYYKKYYRQSMSEMDLFSLEGIKKSSLGLIVGLLLPALYAGVLLILGGKIAFNGSSVNVLSVLAGIFTFWGMAVFEECIFRGLLQTEIGKYNKIASVTVPSFLFMICHFELWQNFNIIPAMELFLAGLLFAVIVLISKSITCAVIAHSLYNIIYDGLGMNADDSFLKAIYPTEVMNMSGGLGASFFFCIVLFLLNCWFVIFI